MKRLALPLIAAVLALPCRAEPPPGADPALAPWYHSLEQPETGWLCCSVSDCRPVVTRFHDDKLEAFIDRKVFRDGTDTWVEVPEQVIIHRRDNPVGEPVLCWFMQSVRCFVPASGV